MAEKGSVQPAPSAPECCANTSCSIESILTLDDRGQFVLPKEIRDRAGIKPGERMVLVSWAKTDGAISCFTLMKADNLDRPIQAYLAPIMGLGGEGCECR
jgi:antitoxin PrlF